MDIRFSVIIPSFNRADVLSEAIDSVLSQEYGNFEIIIVDDGSTDSTENVVRKYLSDDRIVYHRKSNTGAADSRNKGVSLSRYDYITFLDSDDLADPKWLKRFKEMIDKRARVGCCAINHVTSAARKVIAPSMQGPAFHNFTMKFTNGGSYFLTREIFDNIGGFDPEVRSSQHTELGLRVADYCFAHGLAIVCINEPLITVRHTRQDHIRKNDDSVYAGIKYITDKHRKLIEKDSVLLYDHFSILVYRGTKQPLREVLIAYKQLWRLRPFAPETYYRFVKDIMFRRIISS